MSAPPVEKKTATKTAYIILAEKPQSAYLPGLREGDEAVDVTEMGAKKVYEIAVAMVQANTPEHAIRQYAEAAKTEAGTSGTFVAIPARSWKPVKVTVEQQTVVKVGDAA